ncbi:MAG: cell division protein SepF [Clostridia bacterium]|nr:cell division protein SepF [Clostridia bacterium]
MFEKFWESFKKKDPPEEEIQFKTVEAVEEVPAIALPEEPAPAVEEEPTPVVEPTGNGGGVEFRVVRPESFAEVSSIANNLLAGCTVVLNTEVLDKPTITRMLDFINGVTYCMGGEIKKVAPGTFIVTPSSDIGITD